MEVNWEKGQKGGGGLMSVAGSEIRFGMKGEKDRWMGEDKRGRVDGNSGTLNV